MKKSLQSLALLAATAVAASVEDCPGYKASNVAKTGSGLTADLKLAGDPCDAFGEDIPDLKLLVEHQTGEKNHV
jgi:alpha-glucosidase